MFWGLFIIITLSLLIIGSQKWFDLPIIIDVPKKWQVNLFIFFQTLLLSASLAYAVTLILGVKTMETSDKMSQTERMKALTQENNHLGGQVVEFKRRIANLEDDLYEAKAERDEYEDELTDQTYEDSELDKYKETIEQIKDTLDGFYPFRPSLYLHRLQKIKELLEERHKIKIY